MENKNKKTMRIETDEEIFSIVNKLKQCEDDEITLLIPSNALLLQSVINLKILKKKASELRKNISIITIDENDKSAENSQMSEAKSKTADNAPKSVSGVSVNGRINASDNFEDNYEAPTKNADVEKKVTEKKKVKMFDIIRKTGKTDNDEKKEEVIIPKNAESAEKLRQSESGEILNIKNNTEDKLNATNHQAENSSGKAKKRITLLPSISSKVFAVFIFSCLAITALITFFVFQKADITIALKTQEADYNFEFVTDESISEIDATYNKIPAEKIEVVSKKTETYPTTGKKHVTEKAKGEITVYNEYSSNPQKIVAKTRFLSKDGHLFRVAKSIIIPGFSKVEGKDVPGEVTATVYADAPGEKYNIGASSFTLPGLQGHPKYSGVYARSTQAMSGGIDKDVLYFSESDYITAKDKLVKIAEEKSDQDFLSKISDQVILLENTKERSDTEVKTNIKIGAAADDFQMTILVKTSALSINKNNLDNLISAKINSELGKNMELVEGSRNYEIGEIVKNEDGSVTIPIHITQGLITKINIDKIKEEIAGKSELELNNYFNNIREIESVNVEFWPKWVKSVPASWDKINIKFKE